MANQARYFNSASSQYLTVTGYKGVCGTGNPFSISLWVKIANEQAADIYMIGWGTNNAGKRFDTLSDTSSGDVLKCSCNAGNIEGDDSLDDGAWHHIVVICDGTKIENTKLYVDNHEQTYSKNNENLNITANNDVYIGKYSNGAIYMLGAIDELAVWSEALDANDVADLYNAGDGLYIDASDDWPTNGGSIGTNLELLYHFDGDDADESGNSRDAAQTNNPTFVAGHVEAPTGTNMQVKVGGVDKVVSSIQVCVDGVFKDVTGASVMVDGNWKTIF